MYLKLNCEQCFFVSKDGQEFEMHLKMHSKENIQGVWLGNLGSKYFSSGQNADGAKTETQWIYSSAFTLSSIFIILFLWKKRKMKSATCQKTEISSVSWEAAFSNPPAQGLYKSQSDLVVVVLYVQNWDAKISYFS